MQPKKNSNKTIIIVIVLLVVVGGVIYFMKTGTPTDTNPSFDVAGSPTADGSFSDVGTRDLILLNQIKNLKIDSSFFQSAAYSSLVDHTVPIYQQGVGKPNPFLNPHPNQTVTH